MLEFLHNLKLVSLEMLSLADFVIHDEVYISLNFVEPSYFDPVLPQKMQRERHRGELLRLAAIHDGNLTYGRVCHWVFLLNLFLILWIRFWLFEAKLGRPSANFA